MSSVYRRSTPSHRRTSVLHSMSNRYSFLRSDHRFDSPPHRSFPNSQLHPSPPTSPAVPPSHASDTTIAQQNSDSSSGSSDAKEQNQKAHTHSQELEKQVEKLWLELNLKLRLREDLETRSKELDQKMIDINPKLQEGHIIGWLQTPDIRTRRQGEKKHYNQKVDVYSFVIVSWELLHNKLPFEGMYNLQATYSAAFKNVRPINQLVISMLRTGGFQTPLKQPEATPCYTPSLGLGIVNTSSLTHQPQPASLGLFFLLLLTLHRATQGLL
ncbi:unnamed protein product [Lactuca virosa]|uniref:Protein kinase domain-containing protein n=1 Tax=Lactuca virosa TaxID=75947 RepID=A0AAU9M571_9ASTR|nr:unnamed protein product [Lactuca virosa]